MDRLKPSDVDCKYGAPMGRRNIFPDDRDQPIKLRMVKLRMVDYAYDEGGAYWGCPTHSDVYFAQGDQCEVYVWGKNRENAKAEVREFLPNAKFYR